MSRFRLLIRYGWFPGLFLLIGIIIQLFQTVYAAPDAPDGITSQWDSPYFLTDGTKNSSTPVIQSDSSGNLMVMYVQEDNTGFHTPYFRAWNKSTNTWTQPTPIHQDASRDLVLIKFAFDGNDRAHAVWVSFAGAGGSIYYSSASKADWSQGQWPSTYTKELIASAEATDPAIHVDSSNNLHLVWAEGITRQIYYATKVGNIWSTSKQLTTSGGDSQLPDITTDDNNDVHVVWEEIVVTESKIQYMKQVSSGGWGTAVDISPGTISQAIEPTILANGNTIHVSFGRRISQDDSEFTAHHRKYTPGSGWSSTETIRDSTLYMNTADPAILDTAMVLCDNAVHYYYHASPTDNSNSTREQILGKSNPGNEWSTRQFATDKNDGKRAIRPAMACSGTTLYIAFESILASNPHTIAVISQKETLYLPIVVK